MVLIYFFYFIKLITYEEKKIILLNQERNLQLNKMAHTQKLSITECQVYEPEFNIDTNEYNDVAGGKLYTKYQRNQISWHCPCNGEIFTNHTTCQNHMKKGCHKAWLKAKGQNNPQVVLLKREYKEALTRNTRLDNKICHLENEYNKLKEENAKQKEENAKQKEESDRIIAELKEANKREIEKAVKAEKHKEILKQKAKKHMEDLKENLKKEKEQKEGLQRDNIKLQEKQVINFHVSLTSKLLMQLIMDILKMKLSL